jgi:serine/threonine protein kinase
LSILRFKQPVKSINTIDDAESVRSQRLFSQLGIDGELVAIVPSSHGEEMRLIYQTGLRLMFIRFSDPALAMRADRMQELVAFIHKLESVGFSQQHGQISGRASRRQIWLSRPYYHNIVKDIEPENTSFLERSEVVLQIVESLKVLHRYGYIHGHLVLGNIALDAGQARLLDIGLKTYGTHIPTDVAPEIKQGIPASIATDIYGLGVVIATLISNEEMKSKQRECLNQMLSKDLWDRPSLDWVEEVFLSKSTNQTIVKKIPHSVNVPLTEPVISATKEQKKNNNISWFIPVLLFTSGLVAIGGIGYRLWISPRYNPAEYTAYWKSGNPALMRIVGLAAVKDYDETAQFLILNSAKTGKNASEIDIPLLKIGFDKRWLTELSSEDRATLLRFSLRELISDYIVTNNTIHPGILLGLIITGNVEEIPLNFNIDSLYGLPNDISDLLKEIVPLGIDSFYHPLLKPLAELVYYPITKENIKNVVDALDEQSDEVQLAIITRLPKFLNKTPKGVLWLYETVTEGKKDSLIKKMIGWFTGHTLGLWSKEDAILIFDILKGDFHESITDVLRLADLTRFPLKKIKNQAIATLSKYIFTENLRAEQFVRFLNFESEKLSREQLVTLIPLLQGMKDEERYIKLIGDWFSTKPDPGTCLMLALALQDFSPLERFQYEIGNYLNTVQGNISIPVPLARRVLAHSEPLIRTFAYAHLDPFEPNERRLLEEMISVEPVATLVKQIKDRLDSSKGITK